MKMVRHQDERMHENAEPLRQFSQQLQEVLPIPVVPENVPPLIAAGRDMISPAFDFNP